jgi:beta-galactosidase/beta-glucuronidase
LVREQWQSLDGTWQFAHDDGAEGLTARWFEPETTSPFARTIEVPFPPESPASGIGATGRHPVVWYRRTVSHASLVPAAAPDGSRALVHFGAVDFRAQVWCDGQLVASHVGGQTPFTADVTDALVGTGDHVLVVRAEDDPGALDQPRGKQDWRDEPHGIWYQRTTGIWQTVWTESVPRQHVADLAWRSDVAGGIVHAEITLASSPPRPLRLELSLALDGEPLADVVCPVDGATTEVAVVVPALRHGQDRARLLWSPENPTLVDASLVLRDRETGELVDTVDSYLGLRTVGTGGGAFRLNDQPHETRSVLDQGYRPQTHLASRGSDELRAEVEIVKAMGFNAVRVHQKAEDPRFLYWADRLGLMVWGETAAAYEFSPTAVTLLTTEWLDLVRRDRSHPSVVLWVPINESWGVQDIASSAAQQQFARGLASLTRALDPTRPVVSNEGWEHVDSDVLGLHDYTVDPVELLERFGTAEAATRAALAGAGPHGRRPILDAGQRERFLAGDVPLMITEFGGISMSDDDGAWGYGHAASDSEYAALLMRLFDALRASPTVVGFCYTQLMDTGQETNGLLYADGTPKLPVETIRAIVTGEKDGLTHGPTSTFGWTG